MNHYVIFDLEWNQCPDGKSRENPDIPFEIIEIGAIKLNSQLEEIDRFHSYIRPVVYRRLHYMSQAITHIPQKELQCADTFPAVIERFREWCGEDFWFCIWGNLDFLELQRNMSFHKVDNFFPFPLKYLDIQKLYSLAYEDGKSRRTLEAAVDHLKIDKIIPFHSAIYDAWYTTRVMQHMTVEQLTTYYSIDYYRYPQKRRDEVYCVFPTYSKLISKVYPTKTEAMKDRKITMTRCYLCGQTAKKKVRWFLNGSKNYSCLAFCEEHGYLKGKIRFKKAEHSNQYFVVKTLKVVDVDQAQDLVERKLILQIRRKLKHEQEKLC